MQNSPKQLTVRAEYRAAHMSPILSYPELFPVACEDRQNFRNSWQRKTGILSFRMYCVRARRYKDEYDDRDNVPKDNEKMLRHYWPLY